MLLVIFLTGAILWNLPWSKYDNTIFVSAVEPGYLDFDNLPDTNFSCEGKVIGGYYADIETGCQMFHVCTIGQKSEITDIKFLCLNGTVFDQETRVCERLDEVDCSRSESFFDLNLELYGNNGGGYGIQPEDEGKELADEHNCDDEYEDGESACKRKSEKETKHKDEEYSDWDESTTVAAPSRASSTTPSTTTVKPSTSPRPASPPSKFTYRKDLPAPPTTPNTGLQLLALHESFQENLKQRDAQAKARPATGAVPAKNISSLYTYSKSPPPPPPPSAYSSLQVANSPQVRAAAPFAPLPSKLPNTVSNLSQKPLFPNSLVGANRTPSPLPHSALVAPSRAPSQPPHQATYKLESSHGFYGKQHSQKVTNKPTTLIATPSLPKPQKIDAPVLYAYKVLGADGGRPTDRFGGSGSSAHYALHSSPSHAPSQTFKMESLHGEQPAHPTFAIAQNRPPYTLAKTPSSHFAAAPAKEGVDEEEEEVIEEAEEDEQSENVAAVPTPSEQQQQPRQRPQLQQKFDDYGNPHSNFARAIPDRSSANVSDAAVSVVLSTSSVSSSISSKPHSAISNSSSRSSSRAASSNEASVGKSTGGGKPANSFVSALLDTSTRLTAANQPNITEINEQLTEEQPYYEEANVDYDENAQEYKDLLYPADVQKIKQR